MTCISVHQFIFFNNSQERSGKLNSRNLLSPRAITLVKISQSKLNSNLHHTIMYSHTKNQLIICNNRHEKVRETKNFMKFAKSKGHNSCKNRPMETKLKLGLYHTEMYSFTKNQCIICNRTKEKSGKLKFS